MFRSAFIHSVACLACLAVSFSTLARTFSQPNTQEIQWIDDFPTAIRYATSNNLPLMLHFYGDNCPPCRLLEKKAFRDPQLIGKINGHSSRFVSTVKSKKSCAIAIKLLVGRPTFTFFPTAKRFTERSALKIRAFTARWLTELRSDIATGKPEK